MLMTLSYCMSRLSLRIAQGPYRAVIYERIQEGTKGGSCLA